MTRYCTLRARSQCANNDQRTQKQRAKSRQDCSSSYWKYQASHDSHLSVHLTAGELAVAFVCASAPCPIPVNLILSRAQCTGQEPPFGLGEHEPWCWLMAYRRGPEAAQPGRISARQITRLPGEERAAQHIQAGSCSCPLLHAGQAAV